MANNYTQATVSPDLPATLFTPQELQLLQAACGLSSERVGEKLYFFAADFFSEPGEAEDGSGVKCTALFQEKLRQLDPLAYPAIVIHGASTCSTMRPDEFAGIAFYITREDIRTMSTWEWLDQQIQCASASAVTTPKPYSVLLLYPDYLSDQFGKETYYAFVEATNAIQAIAAAQRQAADAQTAEIDDPTEFRPLLVTQGHHYGEPLFDK
jgi:hypothetical protein